jgi:hypothetical protein
MRIIAHRRNLVSELQATPVDLGVEVDIRSDRDELVVHHDPFSRGTDFREWLSCYRHGTLVLNVKEEGLEDRLLDLMQARGLDDFFFLDQSFPFLLKTIARGEPRCAVRVSEYESIETALALAGRARWAWVDCFSRFSLGRDQWRLLKASGFRICLVSPELQNRWSPEEITSIRLKLREWNTEADAVCTKLEMVPAWSRAI